MDFFNNKISDKEKHDLNLINKVKRDNFKKEIFEGKVHASAYFQNDRFFKEINKYYNQVLASF